MLGISRSHAYSVFNADWSGTATTTVLAQLAGIFGVPIGNSSTCHVAHRPKSGALRVSAEAIKNIQQPYPVTAVLARPFRKQRPMCRRVVWAATADDAGLHRATTGCAPGVPHRRRRGAGGGTRSGNRRASRQPGYVSTVVAGGSWVFGPAPWRYSAHQWLPRISTTSPMWPWRRRCPGPSFPTRPRPWSSAIASAATRTVDGAARHRQHHRQWP